MSFSKFAGSTDIKYYNTRTLNQIREPLNVNILKILLAAGGCQP